MKPTRGSSRPSSKAPNGKKKQGKTSGSTADQGQVQNRHDRINKSKPLQKKKVSKIKKVPDSWILTPPSTITTMENILDLSILATLAQKQTEKKEIQDHLNIIKNRFLARCAKLKVPVQKGEDLKCSSVRHQEETKKSVLGKRTLKALEENLKAVLSLLEKTEEQAVSLQQSCSMLQDELEEEEGKAAEVLPKRDRGVLKLPPLHPQKEEAILESRLRKIIPKSECEPIARKLGDVLQKPEPTQDEQLLLQQAQEHAGHLFPSLNRRASHLERV
ncbi:PREDICTED: centromere protein Q isoform X1 [Cyprinodon variegatus]|uniref:Centromere protein Q n=1 Tax=Cyprinodon variegatus TaxID=28743 RepID=A0A3Q2E905_CYPVA|nr:PREDICTED: centromere protein Q isoform X1 [Cyprinodon variegatus]XP_015239715.1 PREDICTED: centromere protein Q isoform X1 [Cyprinodon variegatus]